MKKKEPLSNEEIKRQLRLIHVLAYRLPWITAGIILIALIYTLLEILLFNN